ncbi:hypothetical protein HYV82_06050 [Candidatus Woesearchaeota archaeon]|nr:hypothetical protein [Candidatus Woesearchaeota archaeon]
MAKPSLMLLNHAKQGIGILKLDKKALNSVIRDRRTLGSAIFFLITSSLIILLTEAYLSQLNEDGLVNLTIAVAASVAAYYAAVYALTRLTGLTGHKKGYAAYFRASGLAAIISYAVVLDIFLPYGIAGLVISAWSLAAEYFIIRNVYRIKAWKAVLIIAVATAVFFVPYFVIYSLMA